MLTRLIYASEPTDALTPSVVQNIVDLARVNNHQMHLSGMLAFDSRHFLQVLEGDRAVVSSLYGRIAADSRHRRLELIEVASTHERRFARWSMSFAAADAAHGETFLRFGGSAQFAPYLMSAAGALGLLEAMAAAADATAVRR
jgi:Sensors of blue-light using FAD